MTKKTKKNILKKNKKYTNKKTKTNKKAFRGAGPKEKKEKLLKDNFRNMFFNAFNKLKDTNGSQKAIDFLKNGFKSNQQAINTLIPVTSDYIPINKYTYKQDINPLYSFVPLLSILEKNFPTNLDILKDIVSSFVQNKGNINLQSIKYNISALSTAIEIGNIDIIRLLVEFGADKNILHEDILLQLEKKEEEINATSSNQPIVTKINISEEIPLEYDSNSVPQFWLQLFSEDELLGLKNKFKDMLVASNNITIVNREVSDIWPICKIVQTIIPTYYVETKNKMYESFGSYLSDQDIDFSHYYIILCSALLIFGIISNKMEGQDYEILFKGGKAIQLSLAGIPNMEQYQSDDIDVLIMPSQNVDYNLSKVKALAGHIALLVQWILNQPDLNFKISVQSPNPSNPRSNQFIFKLSYIKSVQKRDYRRQMMVDDYRQFSDVDFKELPSIVKPFFNKAINYKFTITELGQDVSFRCPNIGSLLDEKIYYFAKYAEYKRLLEEKQKIDDPSLTIQDCDRYLEKFKRAILMMNKGLQLMRFSNISDSELRAKEVLAIDNRLTKLGIQNSADVKRLLYIAPGQQ
jgi:hypothetical protein